MICKIKKKKHTHIKTTPSSNYWKSFQVFLTFSLILKGLTITFYWDGFTFWSALLTERTQPFLHFPLPLQSFEHFLEERTICLGKVPKFQARACPFDRRCLTFLAFSKANFSKNMSIIWTSFGTKCYFLGNVPKFQAGACPFDWRRATFLAFSTDAFASTLRPLRALTL